MECLEFKFSGHAVQRMFQRNIRKSTVVKLVNKGDVIAYYNDDQPYPSQLILGFDDVGPVHIVAAKDGVSKVCYIVAVYRPDLKIWNEDFKTRKSQ